MYTECWNEAAGRFECRRCVTAIESGPPGHSSTRMVLGLSLAVGVLLAADLAGALALFVLSPDTLWRMAALVALGAVALISVLIVIAAIAGVRRRPI